MILMRYESIPPELREEVRSLVRENEIRKLLAIHDKYRLTDFDYGCCSLDGMMDWFRYGVREGLI